MDDKEVGKYWNKNAKAWTHLSRLGYDIYRDYVNSPAFFEIIPSIENLNGLDVGCGEGFNTRIAARMGANMNAIDISEQFLKYAINKEKEEPLNINYKKGTIHNLPYSDGQFDFVISTMALMDIPNLSNSLSEIYRVLKPNGFLQFSILHPCFSTPLRKWIKDENQNVIGLMCGEYFNEKKPVIEEWIFSTAPVDLTSNYDFFKVPRFHRTLSTWINTIIKTGFNIQEIKEPYAHEELIKKNPKIGDTKIVSLFLIIRCKK